MDPFEDERGELTGALLSLEFGNGGRVTQLWATDPSLPEEGEEFQFVMPPVQFGEENSDDYTPGTILIGARVGPDQPWVVSRNNQAQRMYSLSEDDFEPGVVAFEYDLPFLEDLGVTGKWFESVSPIPQVVWEVEIRNRGRVSIEIGELGFPLAFNNFYDGFGWTDDQLRRLWTSRVYVHKFIGGAASWVLAQRMTSDPPSLLVFPGEQTSWEFFAHVRGSLNSPFQWEGIPIVYAYSKATIEREQWPTWHNDHTSLILEPGDRRTLQMRFVATDSEKLDGVFNTLVACGKPGVRLLPSAVAPVDVGIAVEINGASPTDFDVSRAALVETDHDEEGAFCFIRPAENGPVRVSFKDKQGQSCHVHLMFTDPISDLIQRRAAYISSTQVVQNPALWLDSAIVLTDIDANRPVTDLEEYADASGLECSLADTLFLAEKNTVYPDSSQIALLDRTINDFLLDDVQNPGNLAVGSSVEDERGIATYYGRPLSYPHVFNLYHAMYRVSSTYGGTSRPSHEYLRLASGTALAMFQHGWRLYVRTVGVLGFARVYDLLADLRREGMEEEAAQLKTHVDFKASELMKLSYPYAGESVLDTSGLEEVFSAARYTANDEHLERTLRCAFAVRSLAPSWWWYGSDKRQWDGADSAPHKALFDKGEVCLGHTTIPNSLIFFGLMDRDYLALPEAQMRMAFGGMVGPWALVRRDGAASMCYCPDLSSKHAGYNRFTGPSGLGYFHYLRAAGSYVLPNRTQGLFTFGCHFESEEGVMTVRPWDGVGQRIVLRQVGAEFSLSCCQFVDLRLDSRKRWFEARVANPSDRPMKAELRAFGLWGDQLNVNGQRCRTDQGAATVGLDVPAGQTISVRGDVTL
ncbi:MAG: hypothetical protein KF884_03795 [Fimbriimonadaceae bacterium]|nr:hypothetical protein [Fimbriimonadaceae bacterium]QYK59212.1 MAG: hypothetical protein KF884_03795 [Fimbriimonadaceae bacterium]